MVDQGVEWKEIAAKLGKPLKKVKGKYKYLTQGAKTDKELVTKLGKIKERIQRKNKAQSLP